MNTPHTIFYIVRHGETEWNVANIIQGHGDSPLTERGVLQAKGVAEELKNISFDKCFSSDLLRAKRTAEIITLEKNLAIETSQLLREQYFGKHEGTDRKQFYEQFTTWEQLSEKERHTYKVSDDVESNEEAVGRLLTFLREVAVGYPGRKILLVCHGAIMRYLLIHLGYITYKDNKGFGNTGYMIVESDGVDFFIKKVKGLH